MAQAISTDQPAFNPLRAYLALAFGVVCIAMAGIFVKWAGVPGPVSAFYRVLVAGVVLVPWWAGQRPASIGRRAAALSVLAGIFFALDLVLWNMALLLTSAATATLFANYAPLWVGLGSLLIFRERLPSAFWLGMAVALSGAVLVLGGDMLRHPTLGQGDLLAIGASIFYAAYLMAAQRARAHLDTLSVITLSVIAGVVLLFFLCIALGEPLTGFSTRSWAALLALGLVSHLGGMFGINYALGHIPAPIASVSLLGQPVLTALLAIPLLSEYLSAAQMIGGALVLAGIYLVHRPKTAASTA
ncbi:MAG TPA: DMT family transporter [Ardenticatenaceae bacterium]